MSNTESQLWALLIDGPDEMHPAPSQEEAEATAAALNRIPALRRAGCTAKAIPWPYIPEAHAAGLKEWEAFKS